MLNMMTFAVKLVSKTSKTSKTTTKPVKAAVKVASYEVVNGRFQTVGTFATLTEAREFAKVVGGTVIQV